ncbi:MAG TPA: HD domain-containing phosphohydrolase [Acidobacteriaceae bacterium]
MSQTSSAIGPREPQIPLLSEILSTLSFALDLTEGAVPGHGVRTCLLALRIGRVLGLTTGELGHLYYAALLKDVGCSSNAARLCQITGGDDRAVKAGVKLEDWSRPHRPRLSTIQLLWRQVLPGKSAYRKARRMIEIAAMQHQNNRAMILLRCDRGASIVRRIGLPAEVAEAVRHLDEHWDGSGYPGQLCGTEIPLLSRLLGVHSTWTPFAWRPGRSMRSTS